MSSPKSLVLLALSALLVIAGCANITDINRRLPSPEVVAQKPPDAAYIVDPPDSIQVEFLNEPALTRVVTLRQDGCVTLPYVEDVPVAGKTPVQIREELEVAYGKYYKEPRILVTVTGYNSKKVFVYGEIGRPGALPYTGSQTVADVIGAVGGFTRRAAPSWCKVTRGSLDSDEVEIYRVNLNSLIFHGDQTENVALAENDVVYVPPDILAWTGYQLEHLLFPLSSILSGTRTAASAATMPAVP